ncbi:TonB-dependent receptor [Novosphingobium resinovorum]|uniref:TonB-dependent receptor n=1 Tax=Novosphingobium resinovorum TaxID=158500 RepID=UPI002ED06A2F|nr:TonB-dependent receptor [Novosphingobium resinovorum]
MSMRSLLRLSACAVALLSTPAFADEAPEAPQASSSGTGNDIVVTAQRREQNLQDVPVAITAFSSADVERLGMDDVFDVANFVPSTHITQSSFKATATYFIRGIGTLDITTTNDPPVTMYENDLIIARSNANNIGLFDVERIEVLRGPQGTLFGRNTSGGAVNVILKKPADHFGGYLEGSYGSYDKIRVKGSVDAPISDKVLTKTSGFWVNDPGFIKNDATGKTVGGEKNWGVREDVRLLPTDTMTWDLSASYQRNQGLGFPLSATGEPAPNTTSPPPANWYHTTVGVPVGDCGKDPMAAWAAGKGGACSVARSLGLGSVMDFETDAGDLQVLYGFRQYWAVYSFPVGTVDNYPYGGSNLFSDGYGYSHSGELKWSGEAWDDKIQYVAGLYYLNLVDENRLSNASASGSTITYTQDIKIRTTTNSYAAYAQADIKPVEGVTLTLGGRFTHDVKELAYIPMDEVNAPTISTADVIARGQPVKLTSNRFTPRVALQYDFSRDVNVFVSATNGFKAGGWNARVSNPNLVIAVDPEKVWSYEAGLRSQFMGGRGKLNLTGFYQKLKGYQNTVQVFLDSTSTLTTLLQNIADVRTMGIEFDAAFEVLPGLSLNATGSYLDAKYLKTYEFPNVPATAQLSDSEIPTQAPKFQVTAGSTYVMDLGDKQKLTFSGLWRHMSPYQIAILNPVRTVTQDMIDASVRYDRGDWYGSVGCTNCTGQHAYMLALASRVYPMDPRRVTATLGVRF